MLAKSALIGQFQAKSYEKGPGAPEPLAFPIASDSFADARYDLPRVSGALPTKP
jgi:hypothetical protein